MRSWITLLSLPILICGALLISGCVDGLPERSRFGYSLPVRTDADVRVASNAARPTNEVAGTKGQVYRIIDMVPTSVDSAEVGLSATSSVDGQTLWRAPLPVPSLTSIHNRNEKSFVTDTALSLNADRLLATYRFFVPAQNEPNGMGTSAPTYFWEFAIFDAGNGRLIRHERMQTPSPEVSFALLGEHWFVTDSKSHKTMRMDPATGDKTWVQGGQYFFSDLTDQTIGLYRHTLGYRWRATVLDLKSGEVRFDLVFEDLPMQVIRRVGYHDGIAYVEFGAQYEFNVELGPRYHYYTVAFDATTRMPLWRTAFSAN